MKTFITSDEHYGHENIIKFCDRPFSDTREMTEVLVQNHNSVVEKEDVTYHIGDMFWRTFGLGPAADLIFRLNGKHKFLYGNHDELIEKHGYLQSLFVTLDKYVTIYPANDLPGITLCHYAMRTWPKSHKGSWHLYGHSHGELPEDDSLSFDIGVDCWDYKPVSIEQIAEKMRSKGAKI